MRTRTYALVWTLSGFLEVHLILGTLAFVDGITRLGQSPLESLQALPYALVFFTVSALFAAPITLAVLALWVRHVRAKPRLEATPVRKVASLAALSALLSLMLALAASWENFASLELLADLPSQFPEFLVMVPWVALAILLPRFTIPTLRGSAAREGDHSSAPAA